MKMQYSRDNMVTTVYDMERLSLKTKEVVRIALLEDDVDFAYVHYIPAPKELAGYYICLGDPEQMQKGNDVVPDVASCPFCAVAAKSDIIQVPMRRFATNILQYVTNQKGEFIGGEINAMVKAWILNNKKYNDLVSIKDQWKDFKSHDLKITCEVETYQNFKIEILPDAAWRKTGELAKKMATIFKKERSSELDKLLGRHITKTGMYDVLAKLGIGSTSAPKDVPEQNVDVSDILGDMAKKEQPAAETKVEETKVSETPAETVKFEDTNEIDVDGLLDL